MICQGNKLQVSQFLKDSCIDIVLYMELDVKIKG